MYLSVTSVSTRADESPVTNTTDDGDRAATSVPPVTRTESDMYGPGGGSDAAGTDESAHDGVDERSAGGSDPVRTRLVESTVVAAITGVFVVLGGSAQIAPRLSLPVALAGVLWLFVRTLPSMGRLRGDDPENGEPVPDENVSDGAGTGATSPEPASHPISTDRRLKMEIAGHGGRMMQKELVEAVDLSESAVSRRLSKLEDDDEVGRVTLGRENLVYLGGSRPEGADSPFAER